LDTKLECGLGLSDPKNENDGKNIVVKNRVRCENDAFPRHSRARIHTQNGESNRSLISTTSWKKREILRSHVFWE